VASLQRSSQAVQHRRPARSLLLPLAAQRPHRAGVSSRQLKWVTPMSVTQNEKAARFRALHDGPGAFVIPNPWDVASARILAGVGFQALATSSAANGTAIGRKDGSLTRDEALAHSRLIVDATDLPVSA